MKKTYTKFLMTVVLLSVSVIANAYDFEVDGIYYNKLTENTCEVTNNYPETTYYGELSVPQSVIYDNTSYTVLNIGAYAFRNSTNLTKVSIPIGVVKLDNYSFYACTNLEIVEIPTTVTSINKYAFSDCYKLKSINIPISVRTIEKYAFGSCYSLLSVVIPNGVTNLGERVFEDCTSLASITFPNSITEIKFRTCSGCSNLTSIYNLSKSPQSLGYKVFDEIPSNATLHVLPGCKAAYEAADQWKDFTIVEDAVLPTSVATPTTYGNTTNAIFSLSGQNLSAPQKGVNIINGKKYLVK